MIRLLEMMPHRPRRRIVYGKETFFAALEESYEHVILHVELVADMYPWEWVGFVRDRQKDAKVIVVSSETVYDSLWQEVLERLAVEAGFVLLPLGAASRETATWVFREIYGAEKPDEGKEEAGIVAAVWSAACKDGATTIAANTAITLAKQSPTLRVGLLDLNLKNPELRIMLQQSEAGKSNALLRPKLQTGSLNPSELLGAMIPYRKAPNLRWLPGTYRRDTAGDVSAEMIEMLFSVCRDAFDVTVADVSTHPDNAATVCAVRSAEVKWLVAGNRKTSYLWSWGEWYECYWKLCGVSPRDISLILNRWEGKGEHPEKAAAALQMRLAGTVPNAGDTRSVENGRLLADETASEEFRESIIRLASDLSAAAGKGPLPDVMPARRKGGLAALLLGLF